MGLVVGLEIVGAIQYLTSYTDEGAALDMLIKTRKVKALIPKEKIATARLAIDFSKEQ